MVGAGEPVQREGDEWPGSGAQGSCRPGGLQVRVGGASGERTIRGTRGMKGSGRGAGRHGGRGRGGQGPWNKGKGTDSPHGRSCLPLGPLGAVWGRREHQAQAVGRSHPAAQWDLGSARMEQGCGLRASLPVPQLPQASGPSKAPGVKLWSLESEAQPPPTHQHPGLPGTPSSQSCNSSPPALEATGWWGGGRTKALGVGGGRDGSEGQSRAGAARRAQPGRATSELGSISL